LSTRRPTLTTLAQSGSGRLRLRISGA